MLKHSSFEPEVTGARHIFALLLCVRGPLSVEPLLALQYLVVR